MRDQQIKKMKKRSSTQQSKSSLKEQANISTESADEQGKPDDANYAYFDDDDICPVDEEKLSSTIIPF